MKSSYTIINRYLRNVIEILRYSDPPAAAALPSASSYGAHRSRFGRRSSKVDATRNWSGRFEALRKT